MDEIIKLTDSNGDDAYFEFLDLIEYGNEEFFVLLPIEETCNEVVILKRKSRDNSDMERYCTVEDEWLLDRVFSIFKEKFRDEFTFIEE